MDALFVVLYVVCVVATFCSLITTDAKMRKIHKLIGAVILSAIWPATWCALFVLIMSYYINHGGRGL